MSRNEVDRRLPFLTIRIAPVLLDDEQAVGAVACALIAEHRRCDVGRPGRAAMSAGAGAAGVTTPPSVERERRRRPPRPTPGMSAARRRRRRGATRWQAVADAADWTSGAEGGRSCMERIVHGPRVACRPEPACDGRAVSIGRVTETRYAGVRRAEHDGAAARGAGQGARDRRSVRAFDDPAVGFLRPVDLDRARREHAGLVEPLDRLGRRRPRRSTRRPTTPTSSTSSTRCCRRRRRDPAPAGQAQPAGEPPVLEAWTRGARHPDARADRGAGHDRGRRHVLAPARTCCASAGRCGPTTPGRASSPTIVGGDVRIFDVPYWRGPGGARPPAVGDLAGRGRRRGRVPAAAPGGPVRAAARPGRPAGRGPRGGVPDARLQRARGAARASWSSPTATRSRGAASRRRAARSTRPARRGRRERLGRRHLPHPARPARHEPGHARRSAARAARRSPSTRRRSSADLQWLVRIPSVTGDEDDDPGAARGPPRGARAWRSRCSTRTRRRSATTPPGRARRCRATTLPVVLGAGRPGRRPAADPVGPHGRRADRRPGDLDGGPVAARCATGGCTAAARAT